MRINRSYALRIVVLLSLIVTITVLSSRMKADTGSCGGVSVALPFNDVVSSPFFCQIAAAYFTGLTSGTSATTYSPTQTVTREQMAAFITRTMDQSLKRGSRRAVAKKWWTPQDVNSLTLTNVGNFPQQVKFDGTDLWVANSSDSVMRIRPGDGKLLDTLTGATFPMGLVAATGKIFVTGNSDPGSLYMIDPNQPAGAVTTLTSLPGYPQGIAFDGSRIWTANVGFGSGGSVSIVTLNPTTVSTVSTGFTLPTSILYDGANMWVTDQHNGYGTLLKLNANGSIAQTIDLQGFNTFPVFDGTNIWAPNNNADSVTVVRVKDALGNPLTTAFVLATLTGNGLNVPRAAAFDGERILVTNYRDSVSLWKAADLTPLGSFSTGTDSHPAFACSDGLNFWITLVDANKLARF